MLLESIGGAGGESGGGCDESALERYCTIQYKDKIRVESSFERKKKGGGVGGLVVDSKY